MKVLKDLLVIWKTLVLISVPLLASPILSINGSKELACLYGVIIVSAFWITEVLPLPVTALLPIVIFPLLGVLPAKEVALSYVKDVSMFSFSCLSFALCIEKWHLHRRIAIKTLLCMGTSPKWLTLGFMLPTWFLSLWINNTSATAMMVPVVMAVLDQLHKLEASSIELNTFEEPASEVISQNNDQKQAIKKYIDNEAFHYPNKEYKQMCKLLNLCVCYSASLGGIGSITGSSTNLIMQGQSDAIFESYGLQSGVNFLSWFLCCCPVAFLCLILMWLWLVFHFLGFRELTSWKCGDSVKNESLKAVLRTHLEEMGSLSFAETAIIGHFIILLSLWLSMKFPGGVGWSLWFRPEFVNNSTPGIILLLSLFLFPSEKPKIFCRQNANNTSLDENILYRPVPALLEWKNIQDHYPWGTWCLLCGGYAIAHICQESGLSLWIATQLSVFSNMQPWIMLFILTLIISFMTEITSNAAMISILCPILAELALSMQMNPLYLLLPATLACSLAFMLPVATPPNAIVFAIGHIKVKDMVKAGLVLNFLCLIMINIATNTWMTAILDLNVIPPVMNRQLNLSHAFVNTTK
ncbi:Na(+)/citrate cotransporter-like isoform X1 [Biomphalaria glabrata]|uniref:Na(+)/citrate cotransporter-like isoform X1 n=2 Tax=Biomphalaria glabrata TaxID=6526 RepID=A0A9W3BKU8_BIOGL|nr:Na(+)/citrate cotransporter-like isoform X1 [Biomphalaria glabrata]